MLWNRSRTVSNKQALMADQNSFSPNATKQAPSLLGSPRIFNDFLSKIISDSGNAVISPTSTLDSKNSSNFVNPFAYDRNLSKPPAAPSPEIMDKNKVETEAIGLALIDSIDEGKGDETFSKAVNRVALFGSKLKVQIPTANSPADFGIKTRESLPFSPFSGAPIKDFSRQLSLKEMEMCEDYTCVITHGPNPKTTHIFDDCIVGGCCGHHPKMETGSETNHGSQSPSLSFFNFCNICTESLENTCSYSGENASDGLIAAVKKE